MTSLTVYGQRSEVRELSDRISAMLPSVRVIGQSGALALAQVAYSMGLNPFTGEIWAIPQKNRSGQVVGFSLMTGIKGLRRAAKEQARQVGGVFPYYRPQFRMLTEEEKELVNLLDGDRALVCELEIILPPEHHWYKQNEHKRFIVEGLGIVRAGTPSKMEPAQLVRKRAEADALKIAFDIPFGSPAGDDFAIDADYAVSESGPDQNWGDLGDYPENGNGPTPGPHPFDADALGLPKVVDFSEDLVEQARNVQNQNGTYLGQLFKSDKNFDAFVNWLTGNPYNIKNHPEVSQAVAVLLRERERILLNEGAWEGTEIPHDLLTKYWENRESFLLAAKYSWVIKPSTPELWLKWSQEVMTNLDRGDNTAEAVQKADRKVGP